MKLQRFFNALVLTLIIIVMLCVVDVFRQYDSDLKLLKIIVVDLENQIIDINQNYLSSCDVVQPLDDLILLQNKVDKLEVEKVYGYSIEKNGKEIFIIEGTNAFLIIKDL